ncbi:MAG TPA: DNA damage-induced cell division inhibitor SosA [Staphylococcus sp.]|nr:DNA damage-induced cell division inhibitor SosA [Staphylococcus sp.]
MFEIYKHQIKAYATVLFVTMLLSTLFILSAHNNAESEQTYEMTDHQITSEVVKSEQYNVTNNKKSEQEHQPVMASVK